MRSQTPQVIYCDFEVEDQKTNVAHYKDIRRLFNVLEYGTHDRLYYLFLYHSLRPSEPDDLYVHHFYNDFDMLIFRPPKQVKLGKTSVIRKIKIPPLLKKELKYYIENNFLPGGKLFHKKSDTMLQRLNKKYRKLAGGNWLKKSSHLRGGAIAQYHYYTLYSLRRTAASIVCHYYLEDLQQKYGHIAPDIAVSKTSKWMAHSGNYVTIKHYIQDIDRIGIKQLPKMPFLQLMDYVIYEEVQTQVHQFEGQQRIELFDESLI